MNNYFIRIKAQLLILTLMIVGNSSIADINSPENYQPSFSLEGLYTHPYPGYTNTVVLERGESFLVDDMDPYGYARRTIVFCDANDSRETNHLLIKQDFIAGYLIIMNGNKVRTTSSFDEALDTLDQLIDRETMYIEPAKCDIREDFIHGYLLFMNNKKAHSHSNFNDMSSAVKKLRALGVCK